MLTTILLLIHIGVLSAAITAAQATGILVHGCHVDADGWDGLVWGHPPDRLGRLPRAALLAWEARASLTKICIGTGASRTADGALEGDFTLRLLLERVPRLLEFSAFDGVPLEELSTLLRRVCVSETTSTSTAEEAERGLALLASAGCTCAVLVSSPTHLPRCLACACAVLERDEALRSMPMSLCAVPSDTSYAGYSASDVVVVEPPHRGDRDRALDALPFHQMVKRSFAVQGGTERKAAFLSQLEALLVEHGV